MGGRDIQGPVHRGIVLALAGVALLLGGGIALVYFLTGSEAAVTEPPPVAMAPSEPVAVTPSPTLSEAATESPTRQVHESPPLASEGQPRVDLRGSVPGLEAGIAKRCGRMELVAPADPADPAQGSGGRTVLLVELERVDGGLRIVDSLVQVPGNTRPALVACAQWALRGQVVPGDSAGGRETVKAAVLLGMWTGKVGNTGR